MTPSITENAIDLFALMAMPGLILDAEFAFDYCVFDEAARADAEQLLTDARRFFAGLLLEAWPESIALQPHDEAIRMNQISQDGYE